MLTRFLVVIAAAFAGLSAAVAAQPEVQTDRFSDLAVDGYDPVAYFTTGAPTKGEAAFTYEYNGAKWRFVSAENVEKFKAEPEAYAPQYGGYCAWAVSQDYTAPGNPKNWKIVGGKLYLNYNDKVQADWEKDIPGFIEKADANWPAVLKK